MKILQRKKVIISAGIAIFVIAVIIALAMNTGVPVETAKTDIGETEKILKETGTVEAVKSVTIVAKGLMEAGGLTVEEGDEVKAGDILLADTGASAALDIKSQQAQLAGLQVEYNTARRQADANKSLFDSGAISRYEYDASESAAKQLGAQIESVRYAIQSQIESSGAGGITATVDGVITDIFVKQGETIQAGSPLFEITDLSDIYVKTEVIADDADRIHEGNTVGIYNKNTGLDYADGLVKKVHLKVENKMSDLGVNQKRVTVEISLGSSVDIRLGSDVTVEIIAEKKGNVLRVPEAAVFEKEQKNYVYVIEGGKATLREIMIGLEGEHFTEIVSGLTKGDLVIISPGDDVSDGVRVKVEH
ncbi:MAG: efflux RND transporter periplasmic adaptor subunit [Eubacteriales bacterium]|nr:efflux RND transporter periplasmic adaptor subunit [Eubacteriales bacterium]MDD4389822.1 efflux RND transporter periplasmic adaptor subunit [Eubacteriales bacterium]